MKIQLILPLTLLALLGSPDRARAHGAAISYQSAPAISIQATYDSGQPMANARVIVYAPDNPARAWQTGSTNARGSYVFVPDRAKTGNWHIAVRQAGHGATINIPLQPEASPTLALGSFSGGSDRLTSVQKGLIASSVIWGFVGTALFFSKRRK